MSYIPNPLIIPVGLAIGILVSAPVGPVNVLCVQRTLQRGIAGGIAAGMGAVLGDGLIALAAAMGIGAITTTVQTYRFGIQFFGGIVLVLFGVMLFRKQTAVERTAESGGPVRIADIAWDVPKSFLLTVTNPGAVLGLFAIFGGIGSFVAVRGSIDALVLVAAIMAGSLAWWVGLSMLVSTIRDRFDGIDLRRINQIAGIALIGFGAVLIGEIAWKTYWVVV